MAKTQGTGRQRDPGAGDGVARTAGATDSSSAKPKAPKTYRANDRGYADGRIVEPGEVFTTSAPKGSWMDAVKGGNSYGAEEAADDAQSPKPDDVNLENMAKDALEAMAAERNVSDPGKLSKEDLISAIRAYRRPDTQ